MNSYVDISQFLYSLLLELFDDFSFMETVELNQVKLANTLLVYLIFGQTFDVFIINIQMVA